MPLFSRRATRSAAALIALVLVVGCKRTPGEAGSCRKSDNTCVAYGPEDSTAGKRMCANETWTPGATTCPAGSLVTCRLTEHSEQFYPGPPNNFTVASAKTSCEYKGGTVVEAK